MSADTLTITSRAFFERTKFKLVASIVIGASGLMLLGFCSTAGGNSASNREYYDQANDDHSKNAYNALVGGYGFACFMYICAFILLIAGAIYISPLFCGSNNEKKMIRAPQEIDATSYSAYQEKTPSEV